MADRLFGTDGIRGIANQLPLTPELAFRVGRVGAALLSRRRDRGGERPRVVLGRDTRLSGDMLEGALVAGVTSAGVDLLNVGVMPTPGVAFLTRHLQADGGIVISASHNPFDDNGIKFFSPDGFKLPDEEEMEIEKHLGDDSGLPRPVGEALGRHVNLRESETAYADFLRTTFPAGLTLRGLRMVVDCAHGATYRVAPRVFRSLGAEVLVINARPNGTNINARSGALHPEGLRRRVKARGAALGLAFDGDGDRVITVDETGLVRDGDYFLAICARHLKSQGELPGGIVVSTIMANLGLERSLAEAGIRLVKTAVGDRYVLEEMRRLGATLGGEQSGHVIFLNRTSTGDGILSSLQLLRVMAETGKGLAALSQCLRKYPQVLVNVPVRSKPPIETIGGLATRIQDLEAAMEGRGRIFVRYSGTEPLARIMVEGEDQKAISAMVEELAEIVRREIG